MDRDVLEYDAVIVGAGPAGLACAIRLKQLKPQINLCVLEKGATVGAHSLSGAVIEPGPLDALLPEWRASPPGICVPATRDEFRLLTSTGSVRLPTPPQMKNHGNLIVSLGLLTAWMGEQAERLGVDVFPGFAAAEPLFDDAGAVAGVQIGDMGVMKSGEPGPNYSAGPQVHAPLTFIAEGCRGSLAKVLTRRFGLDEKSGPQTFGLGMKELWQLPKGRVEAGLIQHTVGWPLDSSIYGGSFLYHLDQDRVYVGFVTGLDYSDPNFTPFEAFQQFKNHRSIRPLFEGGEILAAGARAIAAGGWQSIPKLVMPGAVLIGDTAGGVNVPKIKGVHQAIRSGVLAAEEWVQNGSMLGFESRWRSSPGGQELKAVRNIKPGFKRGLWVGWRTRCWKPRPAADPLGRCGTARIISKCTPCKRQTPIERHWVERTLPPRDRLASVFSPPLPTRNHSQRI